MFLLKWPVTVQSKWTTENDWNIKYNVLYIIKILKYCIKLKIKIKILDTFYLKTILIAAWVIVTFMYLRRVFGLMLEDKRKIKQK